MGTPFSKYSNLKLFTEVPGTGFVEDELGNQVQNIVSKTLLASVETNTQNRRTYPGVDANALYLEGNLTSPKFLPNYISGNTKVKASLVDPATKAETPGSFLFDLVQQSRFSAVTKVLGSEIKGWFVSYR